MHFKRKILTTENNLYFAIFQQLKHFNSKHLPLK